MTLLGLALFPGVPRADETRVTVSFTELSELISPVVMQTVTDFRASATLQSSGSVRSGMERTSGRSRGEQFDTLKLGQSTDKGVAWHVGGPHELIGMSRYRNFSRAIRVVVTGDTCKATVGVSLDPGQTQYRYTRLTTGGEGVSRQIKMTNVSCTIGQ